MSRQITGNTVNNRLELVGDSPYTSGAGSIFLWCRCNNGTENNYMVSIGSTTQPTQFSVIAESTQSFRPRAFFGNSGADNIAQTNNVYTPGVFSSYLASWDTQAVTENNAFIVLDGNWAQRGIGRRNGNLGSINRMFVGVLADSTPSYRDSNFDISYLTTWNVKLTQVESDELAAGVHPVLIRSSAITGFWPMTGSSLSGEADLIAGRNLQEVGTVGFTSGKILSLGAAEVITGIASAPPAPVSNPLVMMV